VDSPFWENLGLKGPFFLGSSHDGSPFFSFLKFPWIWESSLGGPTFSKRGWVHWVPFGGIAGALSLFWGIFPLGRGAQTFCGVPPINTGCASEGEVYGREGSHTGCETSFPAL